MKEQRDAKRLREQVSRDYADAIQRKSCCGGGDAKGAVVPSAGYERGDLEGLPEGLEQSSFGCGNPLAFGEVEEGQTVLDLGSGAGLDLLIAARKVGDGGRVIGIDMTDAMIGEARANIQRAHASNVEVRKGLIEALPVDDASVDWVISNCVINLSPEKERVFAEIARVLKPGGRLLVSDIVARELGDEARRNAILVSCCLGGAISEEEYIGGLEDAGLTDVQVRERVHYDEAQLVSLAGAREAEAASGGGCCGTAPSPAEDAVALARGLVGSVWSAQFFAHKPV